ncbi:DUF982 domain-containing protein [Ancylobacter mangrovi]|uniref:DUF982 domain-containing protein n=1 Tax=Ancylobacter mangrovi TaxID=2972472 RepID=UPI0021615961|nr:DUF982 domain-containing protein [Ancylobacter mangrovi]MCS0501365.1 DUF982 domain-containing protein [Ancylobacter mangrovi]
MIPMAPVYVWENDSTRRTLADVDGAMRFLNNHWPQIDDGSELHRAAVYAAIGVVENAAPVGPFRAALIAAAEDAGILAEAQPLPEARASARIARPWLFRSGRRRRR